MGSQFGNEGRVITHAMGGVFHRNRKGGSGCMCIHGSQLTMGWGGIRYYGNLPLPVLYFEQRQDHYWVGAYTPPRELVSNCRVRRRDRARSR